MALIKIAYDILKDYEYETKRNRAFLVFVTTSLFIFRKMPIGRKVTYHNYTKIEKIVEQVFSAHNLNCNGFVHYYDRKFIYLGRKSKHAVLYYTKAT